MKTVQADDLALWYAQAGNLAEFTRTIGRHQPDDVWVESTFRMPLHLQFAITQMADESGGTVDAGSMDSIPFYSLCRGLLLPLSMLTPERVAGIFGLAVDRPPDIVARENLLSEFLDKDVGLSLVEKLGCILGDPFLGERSTVRRNTSDAGRTLAFAKDLLAARGGLADRQAGCGDGLGADLRLGDRLLGRRAGLGGRLLGRTRLGRAGLDPRLILLGPRGVGLELANLGDLDHVGTDPLVEAARADHADDLADELLEVDRASFAGRHRGPPTPGR